MERGGHHATEHSHNAPASRIQMLCEEAGLVEKRSDAKLQVMAAPLSLNFFMADIQAGIGPFLGVFLMAHGWASIGDQILGNVSSAGAQLHRRGLAKPRGPGPRGAHSEWPGAGQCRPGCRHDRSRRGSCAKSGDWRMAGTGPWISRSLYDPWMLAIGSIVTWLLSPPCSNQHARESELVTAPQLQSRRPNR